MTSRPRAFIGISLCAWLLSASAAGADAIVLFGKDVQFGEESVDPVLRRESTERLRRAFEQELKSAAPGCLPDATLLELSLQDVNSAGAVQALRGGRESDVRVVRNSWAATIRFDYRLLDAQQKVIDEGSANLRNSGFVGDEPTARIPASAFPRERAMLREWLRDRYCPAGAPK